MVETSSPTGREKELADLLSVEMKKLGYKTRIDSAGNVIGEIGADSPHILLCGHMDTIPSVIPVKRVGDTLYGRGSVDAKAPLAAMIVAGSLVNQIRPGCRITLAGVVEEEGSNRGVKQIIDDGYDPDYAIFGEPTNNTTITTGYKGSLKLGVTIKTRTGHSSAPWRYANSIEKAMELWDELDGYTAKHRAEDSYFHSLTACLQRIDGGVPGSVVPPVCTMEIGFRLPPSINTKELTEEITRVINHHRSDEPETTIEVDVLDATEPYLADRKTRLVKTLTRAIWKITGTQVRLVNKTGAGDMNHYGAATDTQVVTYGPGDPHLDHTPDEHIDIADYLKGIDILVEAMKNLPEP